MVKIKGGMNKNYGLIIDERKPEDWIMGGTGNLKGVVLQENGQWDEFLPLFEAQYNPVETYACASFGTLNAIEILLKRMFGADENYSDRFLAKVSGTDPKTGNSPQTVAEYLRKIGVPLQSKWDFTSDIDTSEKFYAPIPAKLFDYAKEDFSNKFILKHQYVNGNPEDIKAALRYSPVAMSVTAWYEENGVFVQRGTDNHWVVCYGYDDTKQAYKVFDSYNSIYSGESKFEKKLYSYSANIAIAKSYFIEKSNLENLLIKQVGLLSLLKALLEKLLALVKPAPIIESVVEPIIQPTPTKEVLPSRINSFAKAIETYEGYFEGSRAWRNKNPGNLRFVGQPKAIGKDAQNFCIFATYQDGFDTLCQMLTNACTGKSKVYYPMMSLYDFFAIYAPTTDKNLPIPYAIYVAKKLSVKPEEPIRNLI